ncbi:DUF2813 domain-containing protein [Salinivibrio sp. IB872]|jgi:putative ATP-dependent endonuclease of OLD family|uniref:DUF2813 domain-containing protein n=1 Tax=Salinivibrio sp. IB872 TaxID=1766123 RepID=UPI000984920C|nr:DUF2813 domain-containing protein [Salinivibrio sp. IB872]OOF24427.1 ATP-dependent endonuclease [Salinivibrio sp. IB872]
MRLDRIEIAGFRGIKRLSLQVDELTVLIGENAWGKSSLLDALEIALHPSGDRPSFKRSDFHVDHTLGIAPEQQFQIVLRWQESFAGEHKARRYRRFKPVWNGEHEGCRTLDYRLSATTEESKVHVRREFLSSQGDVIQDIESDVLAQHLMQIHPVVRVRDARRMRVPGQTVTKDNTRLEQRLDNTYRRLLMMPGHVNKGEIKSGLHAMRQLLDHYFAVQEHDRPPYPINAPGALAFTHNQMHPLEAVANNTSNQSDLILMGLLSAFVRARGPKQLKRNARPIMVFEDPEGRLHPTLLNQAWRLIQLMPMQKILTTNSGDLLAGVQLDHIRRLVRHPTETRSHQVPSQLLSKDERRRVTFHVRFHRPSALFARCWLLVEGETEIWLFNELARLQGYDLAAEGVHLIEFAQSGLRPLIKTAKALGIEWHLVADGDMAGKKYAVTARGQIENQPEGVRLTVLPDKDIEHFLYNNGYEPLFRDMAGMTSQQPHMNDRRIITKALKRYAKPDAALAIIAYTENELKAPIPKLLRWILQRAIGLARGMG